MGLLAGYLGSSQAEKGSTTYLTYSPQRSGQHIVLEWLCRAIGHVSHFNHCRLYPSITGLKLEPMNGRIKHYENEASEDSGLQPRDNCLSFLNGKDVKHCLYSLEDVGFDRKVYKLLPKPKPFATIVILRDPLNWLASSMKHEVNSEADLREKIRITKEFLGEQRASTADNRFVKISYNHFVTDGEYRRGIAEQLGLEVTPYVEAALGEVPDFGGGSSFSGTQGFELDAVFKRWEAYKDDPLFRELLDDAELRRLSEQFFGEDYFVGLD